MSINFEKISENKLNVSTINIIFKFPFERKCIVTFNSTYEYFTVKELYTAIIDKYEQIYNEEANTTNLPVETIMERNRRFGVDVNVGNKNYRARTDGKWGIHSYFLSDLIIKGLVPKGPNGNLYNIIITHK